MAFSRWELPCPPHHWACSAVSHSCNVSLLGASAPTSISHTVFTIASNDASVSMPCCLFSYGASFVFVGASYMGALNTDQSLTRFHIFINPGPDRVRLVLLQTHDFQRFDQIFTRLLPDFGQYEDEAFGQMYSPHCFITGESPLLPGRASDLRSHGLFPSDQGGAARVTESRVWSKHKTPLTPHPQLETVTTIMFHGAWCTYRMNGMPATVGLWDRPTSNLLTSGEETKKNKRRRGTLGPIFDETGPIAGKHPWIECALMTSTIHTCGSQIKIAKENCKTRSGQAHIPKFWVFFLHGGGLGGMRSKCPGQKNETWRNSIASHCQVRGQLYAPTLGLNANKEC